jgi:hypothetical protein
MVTLDEMNGKYDAELKNAHLHQLAASNGEIGNGEMAKAIEARTYDEALSWLRDHGFDVTEAPGTNGRVFLRKYNVSAAIQKNGDDGVKIFAYPGYLVGSEISKLVNRGYQQFLKTSKAEIPATAEHLKALQSFAEELKMGLGLPSLYNESLGTVSESYQYDRIEDRDKPTVERPKRPWEIAGKAVPAKAVAVKKGRG